jgi:hypothetical protein
MIEINQVAILSFVVIYSVVHGREVKFELYIFHVGDASPPAKHLFKWLAG